MKYIYPILILLLLSACNAHTSKVTVLKTIEEAKAYVEKSFDEEVEILILSDELKDPVGVNMAIIMDGILGKGYLPDGFEQKEGYRVYTFKKM